MTYRQRTHLPTPTPAPQYMLRCFGARGQNTNHFFDDTWYVRNGYPVVLCSRCQVELLARYYAGRVIPRTHTMIIEERP